MKRKIAVVMLVLCLVLLTAVPTFAQGLVTDRLLIDGNVITSGLFGGANIILTALASIVFLIVGLSFGALILRGIANMITTMRFW